MQVNNYALPTLAPDCIKRPETPEYVMFEFLGCALRFLLGVRVVFRDSHNGQVCLFSIAVSARMLAFGRTWKDQTEYLVPKLSVFSLRPRLTNSLPPMPLLSSQKVLSFALQVDISICFQTHHTRRAAVVLCGPPCEHAALCRGGRTHLAQPPWLAKKSWLLWELHTVCCLS
jgi:hypothetical protein